MTPERHARLRELFHRAIESPEAERAALLAALEIDDADLAGDLAALLAEAGTGAGHDLPAVPPAGVAVPSPWPTQLGRWRILGELGRGGMGWVLLAERADGAYDQRAAVKILDPLRLGSREVAERLLAERRLLARLVHPSIARLLDGGTAPGGEPFFVMELVEGQRIDEYVAAHRLDLATTLRLFLDVCAAVEYAHRNLIVHRDLKPSNVLVTADGVAKLLDFGIAKLLDPALDPEAAVETRHGHSPMTIRYAAPEQVRGEPVTVATDVYALGVLLYELLTGTSPYGEDSRTLPALLRAVCEREPLPPSTVDLTLPLLTAPAAAEGKERGRPRRRRALRGDLDAIVLKALRKEPTERYGSVAELADDLRRHLDGRPVLARRGSRLYRATKFVRRNRWPLATGAAALVLLSFYFVERERQLREVARERDKAREVTETMVGLFELSDPSEARGTAFTVREALDRGAERIDRELAGQPEVRATLLETMGRVYHNLGLYARGRVLLEKATALSRTFAAPGDLSSTLLFLARAEQTAGDLPAAEKTFTEALGEAKRARDPVREAHVLAELARLRSDQGDWKEAERLHREADAIYERMTDARPLDRAENLSSLALVVQAQGKRDGAKTELTAAEGWLRKGHGDDPVREAMIGGELGIAYRWIGEPLRAAELLDSSLALLRSVVPGDHVELANLLNNRAMVAADQGDLPAAAAGFDQAAAMWRRLMGDDHPRVALATANLGVLSLRRGDWRRAADLIGHALEVSRRRLPADHPDLCVDLENLADARLELGDPAGAFALIDESEKILEQKLKPPNASLARILARRARHADRAGRLAEADQLSSRALAMYSETQAPDSPAIAAARGIRGRVLLSLGRGTETLPLLEEALASRLRALGPDHYETAHARSLLGGALVATGATARAVPELEKALADLEHALLPSHYAVAETRARLADALALRGDRARAAELRQRALADLRTSYPHGHPLIPKLEKTLAGS